MARGGRARYSRAERRSPSCRRHEPLDLPVGTQVHTGFANACIGSLLESSHEVARLDSVTAPGLLAFSSRNEKRGESTPALFPVAPLVSIARRLLALQPSMFRGADPSAKSYCHSRARVSRSTDLTQAGIQYACIGSLLE